MKIIMILICSLFLFGCGDNNSDDQDDLFSIKVVDENGECVPNLEVRVNNAFSNSIYGGRPSTVIGFHSCEDCRAKIEIFDLYDQLIKTLYEGYIYSNQQLSASWTGNNDNNEPANMGGTNIFKYKLTLTGIEDSTEVIFEDSKYMCMELLTETDQSKIGQTDSSGRFVFNNFNAFPQIVGDLLGEQPFIDEDGNHNGNFVLSDSINIMLIDLEEEKYVMHTVLMDDTETNHYELIWSDPQDLINYRDLTLSSFEGFQSDNEIIIKWSTTMQNDLAEFNLYRSTTDIQEEAFKLNPEIISAGYQPDGADYIFHDDNLDDEDITYFYWLEAVDNSGVSQSYGPVEVCFYTDFDNEIPVEDHELKQNYPNPFN